MTDELPPLARELIAAGLLTLAGGVVGVDFYVIRVHSDRLQVEAALGAIAAIGLLRVAERWQCPQCDTSVELEQDRCTACGTVRTGGNPAFRIFSHPEMPQQRDPAAVFLVHGMNTLGDWQQSFAWRVELLYGYSLPVFVFKFGRDHFSPLTAGAQRRRVRQLAQAMRGAQCDLQVSGRNRYCDVIAHSFGTLLLAQLLVSQEFEDISLGRVILTGSIIPERYDWKAVLLTERVEAVLNHRAGRDVWVRLAPWMFPGVGASGVHGFADDGGLEDELAPDFSHSDFFVSSNYGSVVRNTWAPFLSRGAPREVVQHGGTGVVAGRSAFLEDRRYWVGRSLLVVVVTLGAIAVLRLLVVLGNIAATILKVIRY